jgi:hypothetical protein
VAPENSRKLVKTLINALFISEFPSVKSNSQSLRLFQVIRYLLPVNDTALPGKVINQEKEIS